MKKHWKKILLSFVVLLLAVGGYLLYIFKFKEYDIADEEVEEITKETYKLELPDGSTIELDEDGNIVESDSSTDGKVAAAENDDSSTGGSSNGDSDQNDSSNGSSGSNSGTSPSTNSDSSNQGDSNGSGSNGSGSSGNTGGSTGGSSNSGEVTVASIKEKYSPVMNDLSSQANSRIDALVGRAMNEYQTKKANGESINYAYFYNKYTSAAAELEGRTDKVFYQVVAVMEKELEKNGFSKSHAQSFVSEYEAAKEARRNALLDKAMNR